MDKVYGHQKMDKFMMENGENKREMALVNGLMEKENHMKESGSRVNIMVRAIIK